MRGELDAIRAAGGDLVFIGNGTPGMAARFARRQAGGCTVLTDPSLASHEALGLKRGVAATLGPRSVYRGLRAALDGHRQSSLAGDPWQQGGVFVVDQSGAILYAQRNEDAGERPDVGALLTALRSAVRRARTA